MAEATEKSGNVVSKAFGFASESIEELKKVSTPTRQETIQATLVTLIIMIFVAVCLFVLDFVFSKVLLEILA